MSTPSNVMESVSVWKGGGLFEHEAPSGVLYRSDAALDATAKGRLRDPGPMEMLLGALAGCTGIDIVMILEKMRTRLTSFRIAVRAERRAESPRTFTRIHVTYEIETDPADFTRVRRAVELSVGKYCSVWAVLASSAELTYTLRSAGEQARGPMDGARR